MRFWVRVPVLSEATTVVLPRFSTLGMPCAGGGGGGGAHGQKEETLSRGDGRYGQGGAAQALHVGRAPTPTLLVHHPPTHPPTQRLPRISLNRQRSGTSLRDTGWAQGLTLTSTFLAYMFLADSASDTVSVTSRPSGTVPTMMPGRGGGSGRGSNC